MPQTSLEPVTGMASQRQNVTIVELETSDEYLRDMQFLRGTKVRSEGKLRRFEKVQVVPVQTAHTNIFRKSEAHKRSLNHTLVLQVSWSKDVSTLQMKYFSNS